MNVDFSENHFMHATNNGGKMRAGIFVNSEYDLPEGRIKYDPEMEEAFSSAGTLNKLWELIRANGLDPDVVWGNILALFARTHAGSNNITLLYHYIQ